ncbi:uncharacterized protein LOC144917405 [Branchiostoma floridae x Branchiostoma belcheri]
MDNIALVCLLAVVSQTASLSGPPAQPPSWPQTFSVTFQEERHISVVPVNQNVGAWHYDFANSRARFDYSQGQADSFCTGRGLTLKDEHGDCQLFFSTLGLYVNYPHEQQCCRACGPAQYCSVIKPTWLAGATYLGEENINGTACHGWEKQGAVATDRWYQTEDGKPCQYWEKLQFVPHITHVITFNITSYQLNPISASVFNVPKYCNSTCPIPYPPH